MDILASARKVIAHEAQVVAAQADHLGPAFEQAVKMILNCRGRVVASGMGKAGLIARKVAATLASTGTPSFFLHPAEGVHGDLGMITGDDLGLFFSHQGQTEEVLRILPYFKHIGAPIISITGAVQSELARYSDVTLRLVVDREACPLNLAPTSSTTAMLALGDTIALVLLEARGFTEEDYARFHPGGSLGRRLLIKVGDLMHRGSACPVVQPDTALKQAVLTMTSCNLACACVCDEDQRLLGFFSDGDLRRLIYAGDMDMDRPIGEVMTLSPKVVHPEMMAVRALEILREFKIISLPVCDEAGRLQGLLHLHDITRAGIS